MATTCPGDVAVHMRKVMAIPRVGEVCATCLSFVLLCFDLGFLGDMAVVSYCNASIFLIFGSRRGP